MKSELLAPAKDKETAFAAINCGADAVYIGASYFGARHNAANSIADIKEVINYAHKFWAKVFVTVNTILTDEELDRAVELVIELDKIGADAILVQDMGLLYRLAELVNKGEISIPIHMSTQCDNRNIEKIKFYEKIGVSRVVLARELSLSQICEIHKACPNLELEAFVHGALCVSYSGQCYLSQYIGGRSANRGECAQPCRKKYTVKTDNGKILAKNIHPLCLKDFNASKHIKEMIDAGIFSFKIEGRLKEKSYVKNAVSYYRQILDKYSDKISSGKSDITFIPNPEKSFNRGFTDYFLEKRKDCFNFISPKSIGEYLGKVIKSDNKSFVLDTNKKINPQDGLCYQNGNDISGMLVNKVVDGQIYPNKEVNISIGNKIYRNLDVEFENELLKPVKRRIGINIELKNRRLIITDEDNNTAKMEIISREPAKNQQKMNDTFVKQISKTGESDFYIKNIVITEDIPFMPISEINELRRTILEKLMSIRLKQYKRDKQKELNFCQYYTEEVDYRANVHNKTARNFYEECGCNAKEMSLESKLPDRSIELMRTKHCIKYALNMCKSPEKLILADEYNTEFPLQFDCKNCEMVVLSPKNKTT